MWIRSNLLKLVLVVGCALPVPSARAANRAPGARPGREAGGRIRLANGWALTPAGRQVRVGDFPLAVCVSPDGRWAVVNHADYVGSGFSVVDLDSGRVTQEVAMTGAWLGLAFLDHGTRFAASAGLSNRIDLYDFANGRASRSDSITLGPPWSAGGLYPQGKPVEASPGAIWPTGLCADEARGRLYVVSRLDSSLRVIDLASRSVVGRVGLRAVPYTCVLSGDGAHVLVSLWDRAAVAVVDADRPGVEREVGVGDHPCAMVQAPDGRLFVANANANTVSVVDLATGRVSETLNAALDPHAPAGSTPNALALDADGRLVVADADNNCLAVFDITHPGEARALGFVPTGYYPTGVALRPGRRQLVVVNAKGTGTGPSTAPPDTGAWCRYLLYGTDGRGSLSLVPEPGPRTLARWTRQVIANTPVARTAGVAPAAGPIPSRPGGRSPIRHVFYIFKENRSYDDIFGDVAEGDGAPSLCIFGANITPNHHALARRFVLFDNAYCDADGSADGHNWGMGAYSDDYVTKSVGPAPIYDYEGGNPLAYPSSGYLWDACRRHGVSCRSYGEFVFNPDDPRDTVRAAIPGLEGRVAPHYRGFDLAYSDLDRYAAWLAEFDRYDRDGGLPQLEIIRLPNDHTEGTCSGRPTPRADVAENDLALGLMVERISHSRYWKESAIFVMEDDAANGPDHVDAHRTVALAIGPWVRRHAVDHHLYTSSGMLRTIELILGLPPMSQFDAAATPMSAAFTATPDPAPYVHEEARVDLHETNLAGAYGQARSDRMNFKVADAAPPDQLAEILWRDARGAAAPLPPPVRGTFALRLPRPGGSDRDAGRPRRRREAE